MAAVGSEKETPLGTEGFSLLDFNASINATNDIGFNNIIPLEGVRVGVIVNTVLSAWITLINILFIIVLLANKHLRRPSSMFLLNMSFSDLCVGAFIMPFKVLVDLKGSWVYGELLCQIFTAANVVLCGHSIYALFMVNVDRLSFITQPINYRKRMNNVGVVCLILVTWILAVGVVVPMFLDLQDLVSVELTHGQTCVPMFSALYIFASGLAQYYVPAAFILMANLVLFVVAVRMKPFVQLKSAGKDNHIGFHQDSRQDAKNTVLVMSIVNAVFLFMWLPYFLITLISFIKPEFEIQPLVLSISVYLGYACSGLIPILWAIDKDVRTGYWRILWCKYCGRQYEYKYSFNGSSGFTEKKNVEMTRI